MQSVDSASSTSASKETTRTRRWLRSVGLPALLVVWWFTVPASASLSYCEQTCSYDSKCGAPCLINYDDPSTCGQFGVCWSTGYCGDGFCSYMDGETVGNCATDCFIGPGSSPPPNEPTCGNSQCETGESNKSCPADCSHSNPTQCGDGRCEIGETFNNCPADCTYTDWCNSTGDCDTNYTCRARRCVYDPLATTCSGSGGGIECASNEKCAQVNSQTGYGVCVPFF